MTLPSSKNGAVRADVSSNRYGNGKLSYMPNPPRTDVFPVRKGSQEKPTRGSKSSLVGFEKNGEPRCGVVEVKEGRFESFPSASLITVDPS